MGLKGAKFRTMKRWLATSLSWLKTITLCVADSCHEVARKASDTSLATYYLPTDRSAAAAHRQAARTDCNDNWPEEQVEGC